MLNTSNNRISTTLPVEWDQIFDGTIEPGNVVITPDGRYAYVSGSGSYPFAREAVSVVNLANDKIVDTVPVGDEFAALTGVAVTSTGGMVYALNPGDHDLVAISTATNTGCGGP